MPLLQLPKERRNDSTSLTVQVTPSMAVTMLDALPYLIDYPYGCTEQLVSGAYPLLYGAELDPKLRRSNAGLNQAVGKLLDRQSLDGAFGLWRVGDAEADPWLGAYATDFLIEARRLGAPAPQAAIDRALVALREVSRPDGYANVSYRMDYPDWWAGSSEASKRATAALRRRASAYALYVLAKGGKGDLARLRWWHDVQMKTEDSPLAKAQIGAGLAMMGDRARAHSAFLQAVRSLGYKEETDWYQSPLRDLSGITARARQGIGHPEIMEEVAFELAGSALGLAGSVRRGPSPAQHHGRLTRVLRYMATHSAAPHKLTGLASMAAMSPYHFLRTFRAVTGVTPHQWLLRARLREAAERLANTNTPVTNVALDVGFDDLSNFTRSFRAEFGAAPREYRLAA